MAKDISEDVGDDRPEAKPFAAILQEHRRGALHAELSEQFADLCAAAIEHKKSGELRLTIKVKPGKDGVTAEFTDDLHTKVPKADRGASIFYIDKRGNASRSNPNQAELPLRDVSTPASEKPPLREAN